MIHGRDFVQRIVAAPLAAHAQRPPKAKALRRVGILLLHAPPGAVAATGDWTPLRKLGWTEGENLIIERRWANNRPELLTQLAAELVRLEADVIVIFGTVATTAAKNATASIPIVMLVGDAVAIGGVAGLARPGGDVTEVIK